MDLGYEKNKLLPEFILLLSKVGCLEEWRYFGLSSSLYLRNYDLGFSFFSQKLMEKIFFCYIKIGSTNTF